MKTVSVSPKFQVVIPRRIREALSLRPGQKMQALQYADRVEYTRISHLDPADRSEGRGNAGETADSLFHPSRPSGLGYLIWSKALICQPEVVQGSGQTPIHLGNPGYILFSDQPRDLVL